MKIVLTPWAFLVLVCWLRSANSNSTDYSLSVDPDGSIFNYGARSTYGVAPAFRILD